MNTKQRAQKVTEYLSRLWPDAQTELEYVNPFQLLVATILSAQCTDKRVNLITPLLFQQFPDPVSMMHATEAEIYTLIKSCSYPNSKAKHLSQMAKMLCTSFNGKVPETTDDLMKLPGVGRKTANVVASVLYNKPVFAVDTHVFRVSVRIGLAPKAKNPLQVEKQLTLLFPPDIIPKAHHWLILHGRYVCRARNPLCKSCALTEICQHYKGKINRKRE